ncbi:hypothetical protein JZ751_028629 [Albula glossodonta]|uniref:Uncharacterized protein n=1 Tax=Albula glossodonta TaxID=121402 RepID=A0A8T2NAP5_9TELE|nr:hypothetical protein JZ751_028629 [Albula glossodonta]
MQGDLRDSLPLMFQIIPKHKRTDLVSPRIGAVSGLFGRPCPQRGRVALAEIKRRVVSRLLILLDRSVGVARGEGSGGPFSGERAKFLLSATSVSASPTVQLWRWTSGAYANGRLKGTKGNRL